MALQTFCDSLDNILFIEKNVDGRYNIYVLTLLTYEQPEEQRHDHEAGVGGAVREEEHRDGGQDDGRVRHNLTQQHQIFLVTRYKYFYQRVDPGEVRHPAGEDAAQRVGDPDDGDQEGGVLHTDALLNMERNRGSLYYRFFLIVVFYTWKVATTRCGFRKDPLKDPS